MSIMEINQAIDSVVESVNELANGKHCKKRVISGENCRGSNQTRELANEVTSLEETANRLND